MQLDDALLQIAQIRRQLARSEVFRGYRAATTAFSGLVALLASIVQALWLPATLEAYLALWLIAAALSLAVVGSEMFISCRRAQSALRNEMTFSAIEQFAPSLVAGALLTLILVRFAPDALWLLPGVWAILFGLGIFASRRLLPGGAGAVGFWYLFTGFCSIALASQSRTEFSAWHMGVMFGCGQLIAAGMLYWNLERADGWKR
jgi:type IV secretory pathway TrbD component